MHHNETKTPLIRLAKRGVMDGAFRLAGGTGDEVGRHRRGLSRREALATDG